MLTCLDPHQVFYSKRGYLLPKREAALVEASGASPTYGEITGAGVEAFLSAVPLQYDDVLVDLGSGLGRLVLQTACRRRIKRCVGIELAPSRHEQAGWVLQQLQELSEEPMGFEGDMNGGAYGNGSGSQASWPDTAAVSAAAAAAASGGVTISDAGQLAGSQVGSRAEPEVPPLLLSPVQLRQEDILTCDLADGTAFFLCSTAFPATASRALAERLASHPPFRVLVTSRALPFPCPLTLLGTFPCGFSWTAAGTAYVYVRGMGAGGGGLAAAPPRLLAAFLSDAEAGAAWLPSRSPALSVIPPDLMV